jgi:hypothetical protein
MSTILVSFQGPTPKEWTLTWLPYSEVIATASRSFLKETKVVMQNAMVFKHVDASPETKSSCQDV